MVVHKVQVQMTKSQAKNPGGRPSHKPTDETRHIVKSMVGYGAEQSTVAGRLGISIPTLIKHYREELDIGMGVANLAVAQSLFKKATHPEKPDVTAAIFWLKCRAGWRESDKVALPGKKEQQREEAERVTSKFAPLPPPPLRMVK